VPAASITILASGRGTLDGVLLAHGGTITVDDGAAGGTRAETLTRAALLAVAAGNNISITARQAITFTDLASVGGALPLQTGPGHSATFSTAGGGGAIMFANPANTLSTAGGGIVFTAGTDLTVGNLSGGGGDVSLRAGAAGAGRLTVGNILTSGSGNIALRATGPGGTITQSGTAAGRALTATANGNVTVDALSGTTVGLTSTTGSITSAAANAVQAGTRLSVSAATGINLFTLARALKASNSTSGDITITEVASPAQTMAVDLSRVHNGAAGGAITLTNPGAGIAINAGAGVSSNNGPITLAATGFGLEGTINSGSGRTTLASSTAGQQVDVGTNTPGTIGLTQAELNHVTAGVLQIGSPTAGDITVSASITAPGGWNTLALVNGGRVTESAAGSLTGPNLRVSSAGPGTLTNPNNVGTLAADTTGSLSFNNGTHALTIGVVDGDTGITTTNSDVDLIADNLNIAQQVNAGKGVVTLEPFTDTTVIDLGGPDVAGPPAHLGLTDTELGQVTARILRVGNSGNSGGITVSSGITRHAGYATLSPITGAGVRQTAPLSVANLAAQAGDTVALTNAGNAVDNFAAVDSGFGHNISFTDSTGFRVSTIDGLTGISTTGTPAVITLTAGGGVTQDLGAPIIGDQLLLLGTGAFSLTDPGNDVHTLAAHLTNAVGFANFGDLTVGTVTGTNGITTSGGGVNVTASAGESGDRLTVSQPINTTTDANITLRADVMSLAAAANAHAGIVTLRPATFGRAIDLGTNTDLSHLGLLQTDLNNVTAGVLRVGDLRTGGDITVTAALTDATTGFNTLSLLTQVGAGISQNSGATLTVTNLQAAGSTGVALNENNVVSTLAGGTESGAFSFTDSHSLTVDDVDPGLGFGFGSGIITQGQPVSLTVNVAGDSLTVNQALDTTHPFAFLVPGGADINLTADQMALNNNSPSSTVNAGTNGILTLTPFTASHAISAGGADAAGTLGIEDDDLTNVTAKVVRIGSTAQTGAISNATITLRGTARLQVEAINAGTGGVSLTVTNPNTATSSITSLRPRDGAAHVVGHTVTLTANGPTTGSTVQISFFSSGAQFFEVSATTLNAGNNISRLWISAIGGAAVGSANAGNNTAFLRTVNGDLTSPGTSRSFGTGTNPLLVQASNLFAQVSGAGSTGSINVINVAAAGGQSRQKA
jgi:hypothetical protein